MERGSRLERVVFKTVPTVRDARHLVKELQGQRYNAAFTDARFISGNNKGYDVYAVARTRTPEGFQEKRIGMCYI